MSEEVRAAGLAGTVELDGKTYQLSSVDVDMLAEFSVWSGHHAYQSVEKTAPFCDLETFERRMNVVATQVAQGKFGWRSAFGQALMNSAEGKLYMLYLSLRRKHPDITLEFLQRQDAKAIAAALARANEAALDPNSAAPEGVTPGKS